MPFGAKKIFQRRYLTWNQITTSSRRLSYLQTEDWGVRLFAYSCAISGKEGRALPSQGIAKEKAGIAGLRDELEKTKLDV